MKSFRIVAVSLFFTILFSSCQRIYSELIVGTWQVDKSVSYYIRNGKRIYLDYLDENDGKIKLFAFYKDGQCENSDGEVMRYHIDGDHVYIEDDEDARILKLNNKRLVLENDDFHYEFDVYYYKSKAEDNQENHTFWNTIDRFLSWTRSFPLWIKIVVGIVIFVILCLIGLIEDIDDEDKDNSWLDFTTIKILLGILLVVIGLSL